MSHAFNDTTNLSGLVQNFELEIGANVGDVSGNTTRLKLYTVAANSALADYWRIALPASGTWQLDDSNHSDYPIITTNLVASQRDYAFTLDGSSNLVLDIYKVLVADSAGAFSEIRPVDAQGDDTSSFWNGQNATGTPIRYDKTGNGIFLDPIPSYNRTAGLKVYINREASSFIYTDTTKKPGVPGLHHRYFYLRPAEEYARRNNLANYPLLRDERLRMEADIAEYFSFRSRDESKRLSVTQEDNR